ncbi:hypothetical protein TNCV_1775741 [Trichonephila clavipes]|nr:hypothetical protein TNCV_1775741 [Trichonephila clavipes]
MSSTTASALIQMKKFARYERFLWVFSLLQRRLLAAVLGAVVAQWSRYRIMVACHEFEPSTIKDLLCRKSQPENHSTRVSRRLSELALPRRHYLQTPIFMQAGATPHVRRQVKALLSNFGDNRDYPDLFRMHGLLAHPP